MSDEYSLTFKWKEGEISIAEYQRRLERYYAAMVLEGVEAAEKSCRRVEECLLRYK